MKRINYLLIVLSLLSVMACAGNDKITSDTNILPVSSRQFISDHFKDIPVSHIQIEKNLIRISSYDVILTDGTNVEFRVAEKFQTNLEIAGSLRNSFRASVDVKSLGGRALFG